MPNPPIRWSRFLLLAMAMVALIAGLWAGLVRIGWQLPALGGGMVQNHGPLMISGFLGTLVALERAVALGGRWTYLAPFLSGLGGLALMSGAPGGALLIFLSSAVLTWMFVHIYRLQPAVHTATMTAGSVAWLVGNLAWLFGRSIPVLVPWWAGFLVLTIAGERLELSRLLQPSRTARRVFVVIMGVYLLGLVVSLADFALGMRLSGGGLALLSPWLFRHDIARRTIRMAGLTRFIAVCMLTGYFWLAVAGVLTVIHGGAMGGPAYDAMLHSLFLGFVFGMIFGHAPIIFPAVLGIAVPYHPWFYTHLAMLHAGLTLRIVGDLSGWADARSWGGMLGVIALLMFLAATVRSAAGARSS